MTNKKNLKKKKLTLLLIGVLMFFAFQSCGTKIKSDAIKPSLVDKNATEITFNLYNELELISKTGFAIGHQDATSYGIGWRHEDNLSVIKSDVQEVVGDFPAVYGFDIGHIEHAQEKNLDGVPFNDMTNLIIDAYKNGGIITISWHLDNPVSLGDSWDPTPAVSEIIKGGKNREKYELWIQRVANFLNTLQINGEKIPVIFRPFHEMNGSWFWWGEGNCTASDYIKLWQQTVQLLKDKHNLHHIIYAYSPNKLNPTDDYLKYYPGDEYVDILGIDIYDFNNSEAYSKAIINDLTIVKKIATEKKKLFAFTETGLEKIPTHKWFTEVLYPTIENSGISWVLLWRNHTTSHHYMPFKGHTSENDFIEFEKLPKTYFLKDIQKLKN
jgi:mannan endo-1,4-beta-mannosidase